MKLSKLTTALLLTTSVCLTGCGSADKTQTAGHENALQLKPGFEHRLDIYKTVTLKTDLSHLNNNQRKMIGLLIDAATIMDELYWKQAFGENKADFLAKIKDPKVRKFADINYGPWDRLDGDKPFLTGYDEKPLGAEFYPHD
ncbi:MAG: Zn-dependent hydrolase, partial [Psychrosphaera sp.]|nr:Zn-dependent hydrolase [Psychrosphaera sp.]